LINQANKLATEAGVSPATVKRAGQFAAAVVAIEAALQHRIGANPAVIMKTIG